MYHVIEWAIVIRLIDTILSQRPVGWVLPRDTKDQLSMGS